MSVRRVTCPSCNASANVMPTMTNIKCPSCGAVWNVNNPVAKKPQAANQSETDDSSDEPNIALFAGIGGGAIVLLAIVGMSIAFSLPTKEKKQSEPAAETVAAEEPPADFRVVTKLSEKTRQEIYFDYRRMAASSIEKKVFVAKDSPVGKALDDMLHKTVDREITHFSLIHNVTEDDIMQIVAEGDAKKWPGSKKPVKKKAK